MLKLRGVEDSMNLHVMSGVKPLSLKPQNYINRAVCSLSKELEKGSL